MRRPTAEDALINHSDRGVKYLAIRYTERLAEEAAVTSVGARGDSYDNALAETVMGLYKTELIRRRGPWRTAEQVEPATAAWVDCWNRRRLHSAVSTARRLSTSSATMSHKRLRWSHESNSPSTAGRIKVQPDTG